MVPAWRFPWSLNKPRVLYECINSGCHPILPLHICWRSWIFLCNMVGMGGIFLAALVWPWPNQHQTNEQRHVRDIRVCFFTSQPFVAASIKHEHYWATDGSPGLSTNPWCFAKRLSWLGVVGGIWQMNVRSHHSNWRLGIPLVII